MRALLLALFVILLFGITNLPWTLDDYDQAKQAYTSFEMVRQGHWLYQHTPNEGVATKPPLVGWFSAGIFSLTRSWQMAWRLPSLFAALALLWFVRQEAAAAYGSAAGLFAMSAFGLNLLSARLATLVRTDMPLALVIFLIGALIWRKIRAAESWNTRDRITLCALLTATMLIKGPIVYAFILPGLVVYQWRRRKTGAPSAWSGWWPWIFSLAIFLLWVVGGIVRQTGFYETVVLKEFAGRFTETVHRPQPIYFYLPHLLQKFAPWSLLLIGLAIVLRQRNFRMEPATFWLVCWSIGGLVLMSLIPSKRVDRIYPVIPPLCLLLGAQIAALQQAEDLRQKVRPWLMAALIFACVFTGGYTTWKIAGSIRKKKDALVVFAREVRQLSDANHWRYAVIGGEEEGMLLYLQRDHFLPPNDAAKAWQAAQLDALVLPAGNSWQSRFPQAQRRLLSEQSAIVSRYQLLVRAPPEKPARQRRRSRYGASGFCPNESMEFPKAEIETLWCPWRVEYFEEEKRDPHFLTTAAQSSDDAAHLVVTRRERAFLMMNRYPYTVGHLMAVPYRKTAELSSLGENEVLELWKLAVHAQALLRATMKAQGFNIGLNLGQGAGAGVPDHLHLHIVPRWEGDTNFMPVLSGPRLLSEGLQSLYEKLMKAQKNLVA